MRSAFNRQTLSIGATVLLLAGLAAATSAQEFEEADVFFELNDTDGDLGIHALIDGDAWRTLTIDNPDGRREFSLSLNSGMRRQGLTELFFESAEPSFDELGPARFLRRFPEGEYLVRGTTLGGEVFENLDEVTHLIPAAPENVEVNGRPLPEDCDAEPPLSVADPFTIRWDPVEMSHARIGITDEPIEIVKYQVVLEGEDEELVFSFDLPPDVTEIEVPAGFVASGEVLEVEVLAKEESGNQTAFESCFEVR
jgi:hypothetical protein